MFQYHVQSIHSLMASYKKVNFYFTGLVGKDLPALTNWTRHQTIESILVGLKNSMTAPQNRKLSQPPEGSTF